MEVDSSSDNAEVRTGETRIAVHPLAIVHMSDQFTRITSGGSPLDKNAPVVGLLFGLSETEGANNNNESNLRQIQVLDADDIPVEVSDSSKLQVNLHTTVFPKHKVVGWYRVVAQAENEELEPTEKDLAITKVLQENYAHGDFFCFCLLKVGTIQQQQQPQQQSSDDEMKTEETLPSNTLSKELPINLYQVSNYDGVPILLGLSDWYLETSPAERLSVERVMKEKPSSELSGSTYVLETKAMQHSLVSMKDRVGVLVQYLRDTQEGTIQPDCGILRQIQQIVASLGPLSSLAEGTNEGEEEDVELLAHLAIVARTVNTIQSYTEKFRLMNETRNSTFERGHHPHVQPSPYF